MAGRLSENPKWKVLLLEAGDNPPIESEVKTVFNFFSFNSIFCGNVIVLPFVLYFVDTSSIRDYAEIVRRLGILRRSQIGV